MAHAVITSIRGNLDRAGITLSALCVVHCLATLVLVSALGIGGSLFENPLIHEIGLAFAIIVAAAAIGIGALRHRHAVPLATAAAGLAVMGSALAIPHGYQEALLTICGVGLVSAGHILNLRACRRALSDGDACTADHHR